jgi:hypothetical protein
MKGLAGEKRLERVEVQDGGLYRCRRRVGSRKKLSKPKNGDRRPFG